MKTTWTWIVVGLVVLLLLTMTFREGFSATDTIKDPASWDAAELTRIRKMVTPESTLTDSEIRQIVGGFWPKWTEATSAIPIATVNTYLDGQPTAGQNRQAYFDLIKAYYIDQGQSVFQQARGYVASYATAPPQTPGGVTVTEPQPQPPASSSTERNQRPSLANESFVQDVSVYAGVSTDDRDAANLYLNYARRFYDEVYVPKKSTLANSESALDTEIKGFVDAIDVSTIPERFRARFKPALESILDSQFSPAPFTPQGPVGESSAAPVEEATGAAPPGSAGAGATSGTTTGGSSGVTFGPNSGGGGTGRNVWGPLFPGLGEGPGPVGGDSTKTNAYPVLLGGMQGRASTRLDGVGIVPPSGGFGGFGGFNLPSSATMGSDANSVYLPFSRQPGDMDLIPDPYRLARNFSTSSYTASKTDPVPFLTDFSSFYK